MHDTCSSRLHIRFFFFQPSISAIKKQDATLNFVRPVSCAIVSDRFTKSGVWAGTVVIVREAVSRGKCLARYYCVCGIIPDKNTLYYTEFFKRREQNHKVTTSRVIHLQKKCAEHIKTFQFCTAAPAAGWQIRFVGMKATSGQERRVQSPVLWLFSSLDIICIWPFECPLVLLQATAHHSTAAPKTIADGSVKSSSIQHRGSLRVNACRPQRSNKSTFTSATLKVGL